MFILEKSLGEDKLYFTGGVTKVNKKPNISMDRVEAKRFEDRAIATKEARAYDLLMRGYFVVPAATQTPLMRLK